MIDEFAKDYLHERLRGVRATMLWKLEGLDEYDVRRPPPGRTSLAWSSTSPSPRLCISGDVFGRPFPDLPLRWWDDDAGLLPSMWATADESRAEVVDRYQRVWDHSEATIAAREIDAPGHVPWWPRPDVKPFNIIVHVVTETNRHAGHADILREQLDGAVETEADNTALKRFDAAFRANHRAESRAGGQGGQSSSSLNV